MTAQYLLGIDIGTYSSKGVLVKETGQVVASHTIEHPLEMPHPGWAEHDAETTWWRDFTTITSRLLESGRITPRQIAGIGFSGISPAILPIDRAGRPLRKAILYGIDTRCTREVDELQQIIDGDPELHKSGVHISVQHSAPKVLWIRRNEPEVWARTHQIVSSNGFLLYRLTGENTVDVYDSTGFSPFVDLDQRCWKQEIGRYVASPELLPRITWTCDIAGHITAEGARLSGLAEGTPIITGTADAAAEAISAGLGDLGDLMIMYGSSTFFILRTSQTLATPHFWTAPFLEKGVYVVVGGTATGGSLTKWFRDQFGLLEVQAEKSGGENAYGALAHLAGTSPLGANGLVMLPYFAGERTPLHDPDAKGLIFGLGLNHTRADIYRALLESVGFGIRHNIDLMREEGARPKRILAVGGGTYNSLWMQIVSDIANIEQHIPEQQIGASYGDAFLAGVGVGLFPGMADIAKWVKIKQVVKPNPEAHERYQGYYSIYRELYTSTAHLMHRLTAMARRG
jgi:xylulokinase